MFEKPPELDYKTAVLTAITSRFQHSYSLCIDLQSIVCVNLACLLVFLLFASRFKF